MLADNFRLYFTPFNGFFSPFPHGTGSLSVLGVFSLGGWLPRIPSTLGRGTQVLPGVLWISPTRLSLSLAEHSRSFGYPLYSRPGALQPSDETSEFGLFRFRSPLLTESQLFSSPPATWMFPFAEFPHLRCARKSQFSIFKFQISSNFQNPKS